MSIKCSVYIAASVDGFIARPDGDIEWLHKSEYASPDTLNLSYDEFIATVDSLIMGRKSFEKVLSFSVWPYENVPVVVLSNQKVDIPERLRGKVKVDGGDPIDIVSRLETAGNKHLYIDGGATIQRFIQSGLITDITITQIPVLLGDGIPLFGSINLEIPLKHIETASSSNGFVQSRYQVLNDA
jgi:dihydrofolate reductase